MVRSEWQGNCDQDFLQGEVGKKHDLKIDGHVMQFTHFSVKEFLTSNRLLLCHKLSRNTRDANEIGARRRLSQSSIPSPPTSDKLWNPAEAILESAASGLH